MIVGAGCAHVISTEVREQVSKDITFKEVRQNPDGYKGKMVLWGGTIINTKNQKSGTLIEVLEKPLDVVGQPEAGDRSGGRFLALYNGFLDDAIYANGRDVTVAGEVIEKRTIPLGETEYTYPLISIREIHLWPEKSNERFGPYYGPYWYYPYWYDPWWYDPWYYPRWRGRR
jgi:outer membrane lipoprotein